MLAQSGRDWRRLVGKMFDPHQPPTANGYWVFSSILLLYYHIISTILPLAPARSHGGCSVVVFFGYINLYYYSFTPNPPILPQSPNILINLNDFSIKK